MWRAFFLSVGLTLILIGLECLFVESFVVRDFGWFREPEPQTNSLFQTAAFGSSQPATAEPSSRFRTWAPQDWMPWSLMAAGAVVVIYTFSLPARGRPSPTTET